MGRYSLSLTIAGLVTLVLASGLIWLLLSEPVALAAALDAGDLSLVADAMRRALVSAITTLVRYL
ncbi:MAG TPA: hypothetical protein VF190_08205 [Rhodothermales bacterium]